MKALKAHLQTNPLFVRHKQNIFGAKGGGRSLLWLTQEIIRFNRSKFFKFVEIGVFKGDNAVSVSRLARNQGAEVRYVGFDIFDDIDDFIAAHPDGAHYVGADPYWEFESGDHALARVSQKLSGVLDNRSVSLIKEDSTITVPAHFAELSDASLVYIDGCHDYEIVAKDWANIAPLSELNPEIVIAFDDSPWEGVAKVMSEIKLNQKYRVFAFNPNQFFVISRVARIAGVFSSQPALAS